MSDEDLAKFSFWINPADMGNPYASTSLTFNMSFAMECTNMPAPTRP